VSVGKDSAATSAEQARPGVNRLTWADGPRARPRCRSRRRPSRPKFGAWQQTSWSHAAWTTRHSAHRRHSSWSDIALVPLSDHGDVHLRFSSSTTRTGI